MRLALGAQRSTVVRMILREGVAMARVGVVQGVAGTSALTLVMKSLLCEISTTDMATYAWRNGCCRYQRSDSLTRGS